MQIDSFDNIRRWSYSLAKKWIKQHLIPKGVNSARKFELYKRQKNKLPKHFPKRPDDYFKKQDAWKGWDDFFDKTGTQPELSYFNYEVASTTCRNYGIRNSIEYRKWNNRPYRLPSRPDQFYKAEWKGWREFLGENYSVSERQIFSKLNESDVRIIKHQLKMGVSGTILAKSFGVSEMQISRIRKGVNWSEVL